MISINTSRGRRAGSWRLLGAAVLAVTLGACDTESLVELPDPDLITPGVVLDPDNVEAVRNGAVFEFGRAYAGPAANNSTPGIVGISGLLADEMWYASTFQGMRDIDARRIFDTNGHVAAVYGWLHRARNLAEQAAELYVEADQANTADRAMLTNLNAFTYVLFAESFCSGVPFGRAPLGGQLQFAAGISTQEMLDEAIERFEDAIAIAQSAGSSEQATVARLGMARALQNLGRFDDAAAQAAQVPDGFVYDVTYSGSASSPNNGVWYNINSERRTSVATEEGGNGLRFFDRGGTANTIDPRVPVDSAGEGLGTQIPHYAQFKYDTRGSDIPLATSTEARLIQAEALLDGGNSNAYLPILNDLRDDAGMAALTDPGTADARVLQLYEERAFWLWLTGHRLGDLRRLIRHYGFQESELFPVGQTIVGTLYGTDVNFPIPDVEANNPEYAGACFDRDA